MRAAYGAKKAMNDLTTQKGDSHLFGWSGQAMRKTPAPSSWPHG